MSETWLTAEEVQELTAKKRWSAQCRALERMGVAYALNAVGRPLVERSLAMARRVPVQWRPEPNWGALPRPNLIPARLRPYKARKLA